MCSKTALYHLVRDPGSVQVSLWQNLQAKTGGPSKRHTGILISGSSHVSLGIQTSLSAPQSGTGFSRDFVQARNLSQERKEERRQAANAAATRRSTASRDRFFCARERLPLQFTKKSCQVSDLKLKAFFIRIGLRTFFLLAIGATVSAQIPSQ